MSENGSYPRFSDHEFGRRYRIMRESMAQANVASLVVFGGRGHTSPSVHYLSNFVVSQRAHLLFPAEGEPVLFVQLWNHLPAARKLSVVADTRWGGPSSAASVAGELAARGLSRARIGIVGDLPFADERQLRELLPAAELVDFTSSFLALRLIKSEEEIEWLRKGAELSDLGAAALERELRPGLREYELPLIVESAYLGLGGVNDIHYMATTSMAAPEVCVPAQHMSNRLIREGDVLITELSASYWGYSGQVLRPFAVKAEPPPLYQRLYQLSVDCFDRVFNLLRPGATAEQVVEATRPIEEAGFSIYDDLLHGYGGGYLTPVLRTPGTAHMPVPDFTFQENMTCVIQPNVITPDERAGIQVGQLVRITATGCESLHSYPMRFTVCG